MSQSINAADYYATNQSAEKEYCRVMVKLSGEAAASDPLLKNLPAGASIKASFEALTAENADKGELVPVQYIKGIMLTEPVTFAFKAGDYTAPAGFLLFVNPADEDGYSVMNGNDLRDAAAFPKTQPKPGTKTITFRF